MDIQLIPEAGMPLYLQIKNYYVHMISSGRLPVGSPLPSIRQLADQLGISPTTVVAAYNALAADGIVRKEPKQGVFVAPIQQPVVDPLKDDKWINLALQFVNQLSLFQLSDTEIKQLVQLALETRARHLPAVMFIGPNERVSQKYGSILKQELQPLGIQIRAITIGELREDIDGALRQAGDPRYAITMLSLTPMLRDLLKDYSIRVVTLLVELAPQVGDLLTSLDPGTVIGLITEQRFLNGSLNLIRSFCGEQSNIKWALAHDGELIRKVIESASIVFYTLGIKDYLGKWTAEQDRFVELRYVVNHNSLEYLKQLLIGTHETNT